MQLMRLDHDIKEWGSGGFVRPVNLSEDSLGPVPSYRPAHFRRYQYRETIAAALVLDVNNPERLTLPPGALSYYSTDFGGLRQPFPTAQSMLPHAPVASTFIGHGQALALFGAPPFEDGLTAFCCHSFAKPVLVGTFPSRRLVCSLHGPLNSGSWTAANSKNAFHPHEPSNPLQPSRLCCIFHTAQTPVRVGRCQVITSP
jgi:hypothetical protein